MQPVLILNPRHDEAFVALALRLAEGVAAPDELQRALRAAYPDAVVRARELAHETTVVWYVYRDGRWVR